MLSQKEIDDQLKGFIVEGVDTTARLIKQSELTREQRHAQVGAYVCLLWAAARTVIACSIGAWSTLSTEPTSSRGGYSCAERGHSCRFDDDVEDLDPDTKAEIAD